MDHLTEHLPFSESLWFFEILMGILVLIAVNFLFMKILKIVRQRSLTSKPGWRDRIDQIFATPFHILLWLLGITLVVEVLGNRFGFSFFEEYLNAFRSSGVVLCMAWVFLRWKTEFQHAVINREKPRSVDPGFVQVVGKISSAVIVVLSLMIVLQIWGLDIAPLIAFGGIGAAGIAFASKDMIANFFGGLMVHINRPFMEGDLILVPHHNLEGHVEQMGWYMTCIRDKDKRPVYLPNATFTSALVINSSRMTHRRIQETIGISHADFSKLDGLTEKLRTAIADHPDIDAQLPILVFFETFNSNALELMIDVYTLQTRYEKFLKVKQEILSVIYAILLKEEVSMPVASLRVALLNSSLISKEV